MLSTRLKKPIRNQTNYMRNTHNLIDNALIVNYNASRIMLILNMRRIIIFRAPIAMAIGVGIVDISI